MQIPESEKSAQGVILEDFLPETTLMSFSINTRDAMQKEKFDNLKSFFPNEDFEKLIESALKDLNMELADNNLTYENDIAPIFSDSFKGIFAMDGNNVYVAFTVKDPQKAETLIKMIAEKDSNIKEKELFGFSILDNEKKDMYLVLYKDTILITNTSKTRYEAVKRQRNGESSLLANENFKKSYESLPKPNLGMVYMNIQALFNDLSNLEGNDFKDVPYINALTYEAFAIIAESDGLRTVAQVKFNPDVKNFSIDDFPYKEPYLHTRIPGNDLIVYAEAYGLQVLLASEANKKDFEDAKKMIKKYVGLDIDNDILTWMDKGYALVIQRNNDLIPGISLYIDASSDTKGAQKTLKVIDDAFEQLVFAMKNTLTRGGTAPEKIIEKSVVETNRGNLNRVSFKFNELTDEEMDKIDFPKGFFTEPVEIYYGLIDDNDLFVFSTLTGLDKELNMDTSVVENPYIIEAMGYTKDYPYQLSYLSVEEALKYADRFVEIMTVLEGNPPKDVAEGFAKVKEYLAPIKYLVGGNQKVENIAEGLMFIKMEKPAEEVEAPAEVIE